MTTNETPLHYDILVECSSFETDANKLTALLSKVSSWDSLISSAYLHGIFPLFYNKINKCNTIPINLLYKLKLKNIQTRSENLLMTGELVNIVNLLKSNNIEVLAIKGPVLSQMIHNDTTIRQFTDIDFIVKESQMYDAITLLIKKEYKSEYDVDFLKNKTLLKVGKDFPIKNSKNKVLIEFHWKLFLDRYIKESGIELFNKNNLHFTINNTDVETLELNVMLLYLLLHGSKHYWERLEWIVDIDRIIRLYDTKIDWQKIINMAHEMNIEFMFYLGLNVSAKLLNTPLVTAIEKYLQEHTEVENITNKIIKSIYNNDIDEGHSESISLDTLQKNLTMKDTTKNLFQHYFDTLFQIKELDVYIINLPNSLSFLYYFVRLYRLFVVNILKIK